MFAFPGHFGVGIIFSGLTGLSPIMLILGALLPDIDAIPILFGVDYRKTHRTITHSILMVFISGIFSIPLMIGVISHLLADLIFFPGIKLFYPFSKREFYILNGRFKKYYDPWAFINDSLRDKRTITLELMILIISLVIFAPLIP